MTTKPLLQRCGEALYGPRWQSEVSRLLDVDDRTVRRWVSGESKAPSGIYIDFMRELTERAADIDELLAELPRAAAPGGS